jgi:hypothetical protein
VYERVAPPAHEQVLPFGVIALAEIGAEPTLAPITGATDWGIGGASGVWGGTIGTKGEATDCGDDTEM